MGRGVKLEEVSKSQRGEVIASYWRGLQANTIARNMGLPEHVIRAILFDAGGSMPEMKITDEEIETIWELAQDGASHSEIRRTTGYDYRVVFMVAPGTAWEPGGAGRAAESRSMNAQFRALS